MLKSVKYILCLLLLLLNAITLFSALITFFPKYFPLISTLKKIGLLAIFLCAILMVIAFVYTKLLKNDSVIITTKEYQILIGISLMAYMVFAGVFQISASLAGWEKGSDSYMSNSFSGNFPFFSGIAVLIMKWIFAE